jgi:hypothetical protein
MAAVAIAIAIADDDDDDEPIFFERNGNLGVKTVINVGLKSFVCDGTLQR